MGAHPLRVVFGGQAAGNDGAVRAARDHHMLATTGAAAGGGGFLADAVAGVHLTEMIQVVASVGGGALVVVTVLAVHFQVGFYPAFNIRIGVGGGTAVAVRDARCCYGDVRSYWYACTAKGLREAVALLSKRGRGLLPEGKGSLGRDCGSYERALFCRRLLAGERIPGVTGGGSLASKLLQNVAGLTPPAGYPAGGSGSPVPGRRCPPWVGSAGRSHPGCRTPAPA